MTQEPEYIINGTKVEVGQVWETEGGGAQYVITSVRYDNRVYYPIGAVEVNSRFVCRTFLRNGFQSYDDEHKYPCTALHKLISGVVAPLPEPITPQCENGWIAWHGGECPVHPETVVDFITRNESYEDFVSEKAVDLRWIYLDDPSDIIAYRVVKPETVQPVVSHNFFMCKNASTATTEQPKKLMLSAEYCHKEAMKLAANMIDNGSELSLSGANDAAAWMILEMAKAIEGNPELMERIK
jgi:hypothetical protein